MFVFPIVHFQLLQMPTQTTRKGTGNQSVVVLHPQALVPGPGCRGRAMLTVTQHEWNALQPSLKCLQTLQPEGLSWPQTDRKEPRALVLPCAQAAEVAPNPCMVTWSASGLGGLGEPRSSILMRFRFGKISLGTEQTAIPQGYTCWLSRKGR